MSSNSQSLKDNLSQLQLALDALHLQQATPPKINFKAQTPSDINNSLPPLSMPPIAPMAHTAQSSEAKIMNIQKRNSTPQK